VFLHGHREKGNDGLFQISNNFGKSVWRSRNKFPFLAVCPQCPIGYEWDSDGPNGRHAIECLSDAIRRFKGDPNRVFIAGISSEADGVGDTGEGGHWGTPESAGINRIGVGNERVLQRRFSQSLWPRVVR